MMNEIHMQGQSRHFVREEVINDARKTLTLEVSDLHGPLEFLNPYIVKRLEDSRKNTGGIDYRSYCDVIDPNYEISRYLYGRDGLKKKFVFPNDYQNELQQKCLKTSGYHCINPFDILDVYAILHDDPILHWPYLYDKTSARVRVTKIIGNHYFVSDNGYVCHCMNYKLEDDELRIKRKYILL